MPKKGPKSKKSKKGDNEKAAHAYQHKKEKLLLRPDVGLQAQFKPRKPPKTYRYDPSLDPALSWDINADRERAEALIARIEKAGDLGDANAAASELRQMSRPFLNWAGKAEPSEFTVPTLPLFVHERLSTQAILRSVKSHKRDKQETLRLFADEELDVTDRLLKAYEHQTGWVNRLILGDSLVVMNSLLEYEGLGGQVQMIYMDPPYGVKFGSNFQPFIRRRDVKHGDDEDMTREPETVQAYRDTWELGLHSYLTYLRDRLLICRNLLHPSGSIFVQISDENVHHVRELLDEVFGPANFCAVITVKKTTGAGSPAIGTEVVPAVCDYLLWYARDRERVRYRQLYLSRGGEGWVNYDYVKLPDATHRRMTPEERDDWAKLPQGAVVYRRDNLTSTSSGPEASQPFQFEGRVDSPGRGGWKTSREGLERLGKRHRLEAYGNTLAYRRYASDFPYSRLANLWEDTVTGGYVEQRYYVVQTNTKIVARCVLMTTDPGDLVLDPTCGSGTTAYMAEQWGRRWITIDTSRVPLALARQRLLTATFPYYELRDPNRGPSGGFVYVRKQNQKGEEVGGIVPHITLKSIAQNEPPQEEVLVDRPEVETGVVRVSGPFVVEATIPTAIEVEPTKAVHAPEVTNETDPITRMIEVLRRSPTLRLGGKQAVTLKNIRRPAKAMELHAEAEIVKPTLDDLAEEAAKQKSLDMRQGNPAAFIFGPEHGPVTEQMVFAAAKEAHLKNYAHLFVIGFAAQPGATKLIQNCEQVVGLSATYVQAAMDLVMGDLLKTTRASQVFSVTGSPDIRQIRLKKKTGNGPLYRAELLGLDVFDPVTMQNDHRKGDDVPAWFLDTDYDDLVFRVAQAFFPRTSAWENLRRALKGTYEDSVWEHLAGTVSEPFSAGEHRRVAVKVIDDRGNDLMAVKTVEEAEPER
jgi:adenine-specific DNA-methyltransferase